MHRLQVDVLGFLRESLVANVERFRGDPHSQQVVLCQNRLYHVQNDPGVRQGVVRSNRLPIGSLVLPIRDRLLRAFRGLVFQWVQSGLWITGLHWQGGRQIVCVAGLL